MIKFDHLTIPVKDREVSRDWYVKVLGMNVEFEVPARNATALQDDGGFTIFVEQSGAAPTVGTALYFSVDDVEVSYSEMVGRGIEFAHPPQKVFWGYGSELVDPDGYRIRLWDPQSMKDKA